MPGLYFCHLFFHKLYWDAFKPPLDKMRLCCYCLSLNSGISDLDAPFLKLCSSLTKNYLWEQVQHHMNRRKKCSGDSLKGYKHHIFHSLPTIWNQKTKKVFDYSKCCSLDQNSWLLWTSFISFKKVIAKVLC